MVQTYVTLYANSGGDPRVSKDTKCVRVSFGTSDSHTVTPRMFSFHEMVQGAAIVTTKAVSQFQTTH